MSRVFFTSDLHFGHKNIIEFDKRPFKSVEDMDEKLIKNWNRKVHGNDIVYVLGDMFWNNDTKYVQNILSTLNGQINLIIGNHEKWLRNFGVKRFLSSVKDFDDIYVSLGNGTTKRCILSHYFMPFYKNHYYGAVHLYGYSHITAEAKLENDIAKYLNEHGFPCIAHNVGCMHWNYEPVTLDEILGLEG